MRLTHLQNQTVIVSRLVATSGSRVALATVTAVGGNLQPVSPEKAQLFGGAVGKTYRIFVDIDVDIRENDQLKDESGNIYTVRKGAPTEWFGGNIEYQEIIITRA